MAPNSRKVLSGGGRLDTAAQASNLNAIVKALTENHMQVGMRTPSAIATGESHDGPPPWWHQPRPQAAVVCYRLMLISSDKTSSLVVITFELA